MSPGVSCLPFTWAALRACPPSAQTTDSAPLHGDAGRAWEGWRPAAELNPQLLLQKQVREGRYGPGMAQLEEQIAEHNILQKEIEAYGQQLRNLIGQVGDVHPCLAPPLPSPFSHPSLSGLAGPSGARDGGGGHSGPRTRGTVSPACRLLLSLLCLPPW